MQGKKVIHIHVQEFEAITQAHYLNGEPVEPAYNLIKVYYNGKIQFETGLDTFENVVRGYTHLTGEDTWKDTVYTISSQPLHPHTYSECWGEDYKYYNVIDEQLEDDGMRVFFTAGHVVEAMFIWPKIDNPQVGVTYSAKCIAVNRYKRPGQLQRVRMLNLYRNYAMCA